MRDSAARQTITPIAFVNGRGAFLIFPELVTYVQENADGWCSKSQHPVDCVVKAMEEDDLLLYVCGNQSGGASSCMDTDTLIVTVEHHAKLFGSTLAWLRAAAPEDSATRLDAKIAG